MSLQHALDIEAFRTAVDRESPLIPLCGAGISLIAPTQLPAGNTLRDECVLGLLADETSEAYVQAIVRMPQYQQLRPEIVFQTIGALVGRALDRSIARIMGRAVPNPVHRYLAAHFREIFTTNFDLCLEWGGSSDVTHLHGSIAEPDLIQNRIYRLGRTTPREFGRFAEIASGKPLLVLGYSFRDPDIVGLIRRTRLTRIYYLSYDGTVPIGLSEAGVPYVYTKGSAEALWRIRSLGDARTPTTPRSLRLPKPSLGRRIAALIRLCFQVDADELASEIAGRYLRRLRGHARLLVLADLANICRVRGRFGEAEAYCAQILRNPAIWRPENASIRSSAYVVLGLCALDQHRQAFADIRRLFVCGLVALREFARSPAGSRWRPEIEIWRARIYNDCGLLFTAWRNPRRAIRFYEKSLRLKAPLHEEIGIAQTQANLVRLYLGVGAFERVPAALNTIISVVRSATDRRVINNALAVGRQALQMVQASAAASAEPSASGHIADTLSASAHRDLTEQVRQAVTALERLLAELVAP